MDAIDRMACGLPGCENLGKPGFNIVGHGWFPMNWGCRRRYRQPTSVSFVVQFSESTIFTQQRDNGPMVAFRALRGGAGMMTAAEWKAAHPVYMTGKRNFAKALSDFERVRKAISFNRGKWLSQNIIEVITDYDDIDFALDRVEEAIWPVAKDGKSKLLDDLRRCIQDVKNERALQKTTYEAFLERWLGRVLRDFNGLKASYDGIETKMRGFLRSFRGKSLKPVSLEKEDNVIKGYEGELFGKELVKAIKQAEKAYADPDKEVALRYKNLKNLHILQMLSSERMKKKIDRVWPNVLSGMEELLVEEEELKGRVQPIMNEMVGLLNDLEQFRKFDGTDLHAMGIHPVTR